MQNIARDPMVFRPPRRQRGLQIGLGLALTSLVLVPTLFAVWLVWAPHGVELEIDEGQLHITTAPAPVSRHRTIDLDSVVAVEEIHLGHGRRVAGTGIPGYCVGRFRYDNIGSVWQATDCSRDVVVLRRKGERPLVLTPPDPDRFQQALTTGGGYHESQAPPATGRAWFLLKLFVLITPVLGIVIPLVFFVAPARLLYRIVSGGLEVSTMLGTKRFATAGCTARPHRPKVGFRLWGTGAPGYYTGTYRVDGTNTKIYTTSTDEGVLIEGPGVRVFINPENEAEFLQAIRTMGGATS